MSMRDSGARYNFGFSRLRIRARNDDQTIPTPSNMVGGVGPFDFSAALVPGAVTFSLKRDGAATKTGTIVLTGGSLVVTAITPAQWVTAMTAGLTAAGATGYTPSVDSTTGRVKLVSATGAYIQFWGEAANLASFGQGKGLKAVCSDTATTINFAPTVKADTTQTVTDGNMKDTEVIIQGYKKGFTCKLVDTTEDFAMMELIESGTIDSSGVYHDPDTSTKKVSFELETWNPVYQRGVNFEDELIGWEHIRGFSVKGSVGEDALSGGHRAKNYDLVGVNYKDASGAESGARTIEQLKVTDWSPEIFDAMVA